MTSTTIRWSGSGDLDGDRGQGPFAVVLDQTRLPHEVVEVVWRTVDDAAHGIRSMQVRGAPLIGVSAAFGLALAMQDDPATLDDAVAVLAGTRPTAVNLRWALEQMRTELAVCALHERGAAARRLADRMLAQDIAACRSIADAGVDLIRQAAARSHDGVAHVMTHCNAGWLAAVEWGTATAAMYLAHEQGVPLHVWVSETRPRNQGASLTAWELSRAGVSHDLIVDNAAGHLLATGKVDLVIVGADRVAANGDAANKIGTYLKALAAVDNGVPFYVAAPASTFDLDCPTGAQIPIEERDPDEVLVVNGGPIAALPTTARNWGFDVTPARLVTGFITDRGLISAGRIPSVMAS